MSYPRPVALNPPELSATERRAQIQFHRAVASAHQAYADALLVLVEPIEAPESPPLRGSLQRRIVGLQGMTLERGMTSREVAAETSGDEPNCHTALKGLAEKGVAEIVEGTPQRFRLVAKHRRDRVLRLSRLIQSGYRRLREPADGSYRRAGRRASSRVCECSSPAAVTRASVARMA